MNEFYFFQRYHGKENVHSSNVLYMLERVYYYNPNIFYEFLAELLGREDVKEWVLNFKSQEKHSRGVTDFSIIQNPFKIVVEAKEKYNDFTEKQICQHLDSLNEDKINNKVFLALAPKINNQQFFENIKNNYSGIQILPITYLQLYKTLSNVINENRDYALKELFDEFYEYCNDENLIDDTDNTIMVRLAGSTLDANVKYNVYYDKASNKHTGFRYLGLYNDKQVKYIGKITHIVKANFENNKYQTELLYPHEQNIDNEILEKVKKVMEHQNNLYGNINVEHCYYIVDKFYPIENFRKRENGALYGKKKFFLNQMNLQANSPVEAIAEKLKNKNWEDLPL